MTSTQKSGASAASITDHAIILAAGFGSRLKADEGHKLLAEVGGRPMLAWHLDNFIRLGVRYVTVVTGYENEVLSRAVAAHMSDELSQEIKVSCAYNPDFKTSNGISVLAGVDGFIGSDDASGAAAIPFWLTMSDHLFDPALFAYLREDFIPHDSTQGMLVVDRKLDTIYDMPDATKLSVNSAGSLLGISKELEDFNLVDAGLFWCADGFVQALREERATRGDCSTSDAVRRLDAAGQFAYWDLGPYLWQDVDTPGARAHAEKLVQGFGA